MLQVTVSLIDKRKTHLIFKVSFFLVDAETTLVDFRLSKGDGLEFKRHFLAVRAALKPFIKRAPSMSPFPLPEVNSTP